MSVKLLRNLDTNRNKEQEDEFAQTMNLPLYFDTHKTIEKFDGWKYSNAKKLSKNTTFLKDIVIEYSKWNKNIELIFSCFIENKIGKFELTKEEKEIFKNRDIVKIHEWVNNNLEDKNNQFKALLYISEIINNNQKIITLINKVINEGISIISFALDFTIPLLFIKEKGNG